HALGDDDLLLAGGLVGGRGELAAAVCGPGARRELQAAVVTVAGVDGPVAAGLALRDLIPLGVGGGVGGTGAEESGTAAEDSAGERDLGDGLGGRAARLLAMTSGHRAVSSRHAPTQSGVGYEREADRPRCIAAEC